MGPPFLGIANGWVKWSRSSEWQEQVFQFQPHELAATAKVAGMDRGEMFQDGIL